MTLTAIVLAGGRAARLGGIAKPLLELEGRTLLARTVDAALGAGATEVVVAGPAVDAALPVRWVREDPPFTGPAAAVIAALAVAPDSDWTLLLAGDLARPHAAAQRLVADRELLPADTDGLCLADATSRPQWLTGLYRTRALRRSAASVPDAGRDQPVRVLVDELAITVVRVPDEVIADIDTPKDAARAGVVSWSTRPRAPKET